MLLAFILFACIAKSYTKFDLINGQITDYRRS